MSAEREAIMDLAREVDKMYQQVASGDLQPPKDGAGDRGSDQFSAGYELGVFLMSDRILTALVEKHGVLAWEDLEDNTG